VWVDGGGGTYQETVVELSWVCEGRERRGGGLYGNGAAARRQ
jgi:hypothetical protein